MFSTERAWWPVEALQRMAAFETDGVQVLVVVIRETYAATGEAEALALAAQLVTLIAQGLVHE